MNTDQYRLNYCFVYANALAIELVQNGFIAHIESPIKVYSMEKVVGDFYARAE